MQFFIPFSQLTVKNMFEAGGTNASLGKRYNHFAPLGVMVTDGFTQPLTAYFLQANIL
jgi:hypothetical protein